MRISYLWVASIGFGLGATSGCTDPKEDKKEPTKDLFSQILPNQTPQEKTDEGNLLNAVDRVRLAAARTKSQNNLKQIALAMHNYDSAYNHFATNIVDKSGKPLLSWRVAILPYLEEATLFKQFKLDEPWDSEHNKKLIAKMPGCYAPVRGEAKEGHTFYQSFTGKGAFLGGEKPPRIANISDGTSNTLMAVEAAEPVIWTKPDDLVFDPEKPLPKLGGLFPGTFNVAFCDGSVRNLKTDIDPKTLKALITIAGGEVVTLDR